MSSTTAAPSTVRAAGSAGDPEVEEGGGGDAGAGRGQGGTEEDAGFGAFAQRQSQPDPGQEGEDHAGAADRERHPPDRSQLREPRLQTDPEEQEDDPELGKDPQHLADLDQSQNRGPDQYPAEDLADDRRLPDPLEDLVAELGGERGRRRGRSEPPRCHWRRRVGGRVRSITPRLFALNRSLDASPANLAAAGPLSARREEPAPGKEVEASCNFFARAFGCRRPTKRKHDKKLSRNTLHGAESLQPT